MTASTGKALAGVYVAMLAALSALMGAVYSIYNSDAHHWGFILGTALDFIRGRSLFSEVFIQYGAGQPMLYSVLSHVMPINFSTIGFVVSVAYALTFAVLFLGLLELTSTVRAAAITTIAFLVHPFPSYPWPDYLAGLCLCVACYCMIKRGGGSAIAAAASGLFLFLAFLFRNTYFVNVVAAMAAYVGLASISSRARSREIAVAIGVFALLTSGYFAFLYLQGNLGPWYRQNFALATATYGVGAVSVNTVLVSVLIPQDLKAWIFTSLIASNLAVLCMMTFGKDDRSIGGRALPPGVVIFVALLGMAGIVQGLQLYETFRLQNAGISMYLGFACLVSLCVPSDAPARRQFGANLTLVALVAFLLANFPARLDGENWSIVWPIVEAPPEGPEHRFSTANLLDRHSTLEIPIFRGHRFQADVKNYYEELTKYVCDGRRRIVNLTSDSTIPYLCTGQENALNMPFYNSGLLATISPRNAEAINKGQFAADEVVVCDTNRGVFASPSSAGLELIGTAKRPASIRFLNPREVSVYRVLRGQ
ncbi:MAG: hypothetical protein ABI724_02760 [Betaproteobacteria bacterium]